MEYKYQKQTEKQWTNDKGISSDVKYLPAFEKLMDRKTFSIAKMAIDLEKRHAALRESIELMVKEVKAAREKDFPGGPPAIKTFTSFDKSIKVEVAQGSTYEFSKEEFEKAKAYFLKFIDGENPKEDTFGAIKPNFNNSIIHDALTKVFSDDEPNKRSIEVITDFCKKYVDELKENEDFQAGLKAMNGIYIKQSRDYYKVLVKTDSGDYKKVSLNLNEIE